MKLAGRLVSTRGIGRAVSLLGWVAALGLLPLVAGSEVAGQQPTLDDLVARTYG